MTISVCTGRTPSVELPASGLESIARHSSVRVTIEWLFFKSCESIHDWLGAGINRVDPQTKIALAVIFGSVHCCGIAEGLLACSVPAPPPPIPALAGSDAVFAGRVLEHSGNGNEVRCRFEVEEVWKGISDVQISVYTARSVASCGYPFEVGKRYLVYASEHNWNLRTGLGTRTQPLADAGFDIGQLGPPTATRADLLANRRWW
jgi:hypothetical protein